MNCQLVPQNSARVFRRSEVRSHGCGRCIAGNGFGYAVIVRRGKSQSSHNPFRGGRLQWRKNRRKNGAAVVRWQARSGGELDERSWPALGVFHKTGDVIAEKYKIISVLGRGGVCTTYEAETEDGSSTVALKAITLKFMKGWKDLELFEREARVLKSLRHPGIPEYIDYFEVDTETDRAFYIAQKVAKGRSLAEAVQNGSRMTEEDVVRIAFEVLEVLKYLGNLRPPVFHRDIKPENIIMDEETGQVKVVDFGAVQDAASMTVMGSTVVGTYGYMAPEQFQNRATAQTDLYGLGGTLLYLLSGQSPSSFPQTRLKVDFGAVTMSPALRSVIDKLLEPAPEDRFQSAEEVIAALKAVKEPPASFRVGSNAYKVEQRSVQRISQPAGTKIDLIRTDDSLQIEIPPVGLTAETVGTGTFTVAWNAFIVFWTATAIRGGAGVMSLFSIPFWVVGFGLAKSTLSNLTVSVSLEIDREVFSVEWKVGRFWKHRVSGQVRDINSVELISEGALNGKPITACRLNEGVNRHLFGSGLEEIEKSWILQEISDFLDLPPPQELPPLVRQIDPSRNRMGGRVFRRTSRSWDDSGF
ncbi:hypothetical protein MPTK1_5g01970 [Marchantia polymorpha subsp. ruderalis]|uniref:non-specific serine/threonine protein kinase n=2 Tax=Marchantia polymorpha TaxID=3197 RepID=A0AAF6BDZ1_MARPO|nr:hypothetical protein MARPO_0161s0007 [Marchantia polymorpha]BBN10225.1 hypothetical protein Mp_5g01970 [Marchantia polymorpha subsp. ruderalis]|eukprot:PTQ28502.1 hypothetical protein MARPO_0161s0007 [Marchantia polymorpha]